MGGGYSGMTEEQGGREEEGRVSLVRDEGKGIGGRGRDDNADAT